MKHIRRRGAHMGSGFPSAQLGRRGVAQFEQVALLVRERLLKLRHVLTRAGGKEERQRANHSGHGRDRAPRCAS